MAVYIIRPKEPKKYNNQENDFMTKLAARANWLTGLKIQRNTEHGARLFLNVTIIRACFVIKGVANYIVTTLYKKQFTSKRVNMITIDV